MVEKVDTLVASEGRWRPLVLLCVAASTVIDVALLAATVGRVAFPAWIVLALISIGFLLCNLSCLVSNGPTIGMMPVAAFSLTPALALEALALPGSAATWWVVIVTVVLLLALCVFFAVWFYRFTMVCIRQQEITDDAVLIVLGGHVVHGVPTTTVQNRLHVAADLWREAPERMVIVTGGPTPDGLTTEADAMARWLMVAEGVPESSILVEPQALNTQQNLEKSLELIHTAGLDDRQVCIVSSDYHLYRALAIAQDFIPNAVGVPALVPPRSALQQWSREALVLQAKGIRRR
jgi:uncharacterized SAM-binding protein YcdF (DUF218 family)